MPRTATFFSRRFAGARIAAAVLSVMLPSACIAGTMYTDSLTVTNTFAQKALDATNRFYGPLTVAPAADIGMGPFTNASAAMPAWWTNRAVLDPTAAPSDYGAILIGQLCWMATNAADELEENLRGGAGTSAWAMVAGWEGSQPYCFANIGQLKETAKPFYDRLIAVGYTNAYPWTSGTADDADYALANIGQLKNMFSWDVTADGDMDGLRDWWEIRWFGSTNETAEGDYDSDELNNSDEYVHETCPTNSDTDADGLSDGVEVNTYGSDPLESDTDGDGLDDGIEAARLLDPTRFNVDDTANILRLKVFAPID